jgi:glycosyltransferase involved in cell wall biosynthesis
MLRHMHRRHEIHFVATADPAYPEGPERSSEYCRRAYPLEHRVPPKNSAAFLIQLARGLTSPVPLAVSRFHSPRFGDILAKLIRENRFDRAVIDFLVPASYFPDVSRGVLFQHNVETLIWRRRAQHARDPLRKLYFQRQAELMYRFERDICRRVGHTVTVSANDAEQIRNMFGVMNVSRIPTGVNVEYFSPPPAVSPIADLVFIGSMDWQPNVDGIIWFVKQVLPRIRRRKPGCTLAIVGRTPPPHIARLAARDPGICVTGTVPDVRGYLWGSTVSVVPLRIGGGTRLKIYESMAAKVPVVSTSVGAEGLDIDPPNDIYITDSPEDFAARCLDLLEDAGARKRLAEEGWQRVTSRFSWDKVARRFEEILEAAPGLDGAPLEAIARR